MKPSSCLSCAHLSCADVLHDRFNVPSIDVTPSSIRIVMISEAASPEASDWFYAPGDPLFARTTVQAFRDAGAEVSSMRDILRRGVYVTTALKCAKTGYGVAAATIDACSELLERELELFPEACVYLAMGDVAIKAINAIARRSGEPRPIPAGSTYKIRGGAFSWRGRRVFPSYLQAGPSFFIEKSKRAMIAGDISAALSIAKPGAAGGRRVDAPRHRR